MKIESSSINMSSEHLSSVEIQEERVAKMTEIRRQEREEKEKSITIRQLITERVDFSGFTKDEAILLRDISTSLINHIKIYKSGNDMSSKTELRYSSATVNETSKGQVFDSSNAQPMNVSQLGRVVDRREGERLSYSVAGIVKTKEGQEIDIDIELNLSRKFIRDYDKNLQFKDPLVINYNASSAQLTTTKFAFDIDTDGIEDQISILRSGSGYLSLDKNSDGKINNGSELFGTKSGDGFADLALYDNDSNNWIDENDTIFNKLRIWVKDINGEDKLLALGEVGVGAIYLNNSETEFTLTDERGDVAGRLKQSSIFLKENGDVGTIQNIDHLLKEDIDDAS